MRGTHKILYLYCFIISSHLFLLSNYEFSDIVEDFLMMEMYENYDANKKSSYINENGGVRESELRRRQNSRVSEYSIGYCPLEGSLTQRAKTKIGNVGRCYILRIFMLKYIFYYRLIYNEERLFPISPDYLSVVKNDFVSLESVSEKSSGDSEINKKKNRGPFGTLSEQLYQKVCYNNSI
jgi:hypothetical protein